MRPRSQVLWPYLAVVLAISCIQGGAGLGKALFPTFGITGTCFYRLALSGGLLLLLHRPWRRPTTAPQRRTILVYAAALVAMNWLMYLAIDRIPLGVAVALEFCGPLGLAMMTARRWNQWIWAPLAALGLLLLLPGAAFGAALDPWGLLYALGAGLGWALYIVAGKGAATPPGTLVAYGLSLAALLLAPVALWLDGARLWQPQMLPAALQVAVLCSALPYSLELLAMARMETYAFSILMSIEPAIAALSGLWLLGEQLASGQWLGILCIIAAALGSAGQPR